MKIVYGVTVIEDDVDGVKITRVEISEEGAKRLQKKRHHGSLTSSTQEFLEQVKPKVALVSAGRNNRFGHPHPQIVERMEKQGIFLYRTDLDGAVKILLNDGEITIETMLKEEER